MSQETKKVISSLTEEQKAKIPEYLERFQNIGLSTVPTDRKKAEQAITRSYEYLNKKDPATWQLNPEIIWALGRRARAGQGRRPPCGQPKDPI